MASLHGQAPELLEQIKQVQQKYGLSLPDALNYVHYELQPTQLNTLLERRERLDQELQIAREQAALDRQQSSEMKVLPSHAEAMSDGMTSQESTDIPSIHDTQELNPSIVGLPANSVDYLG